jgi:arsenate reductase
LIDAESGVHYVDFFDKITDYKWKWISFVKRNFMVNTIYYLASCDTCRKIIKSLPNSDRLKFHDIRQNPITEQELEELYQLSGSYEALFSKKAQLYKQLDLKNKTLTEADYKKYLLEHYTFLSRPVFIIDEKIYIGNSQKNIIEVIKALS